jgi:tetratricopeptide (TPR) repeat protein
MSKGQMIAFAVGSLLVTLATPDPLEATDEVAALRKALTAERDASRRAALTFNLGIVLLKQNAFEESLAFFNEASEHIEGPHQIAGCRYHLGLAHANLAESASEPGAQVGSLEQAILSMRQALLLRPDWPQATQGLEVLYLRRAKAEKALEEQRQQQQKFQEQANELYKELVEIHRQQQKLTRDGARVAAARRMSLDNKRKSIRALKDRQHSLAGRTEKANVKLEELRLQIQLAIREEMNDAREQVVETMLDQPLKHMSVARTAQNRAVSLLERIDKIIPAVASKGKATNELKALLDLLGDEEEESEDFEDEDWEDYDESEMNTDDSGQADRSAATDGAMRSDFVNRALPVPDYSVEDILDEEASNNQIRAKKQSNRVGEVEKDW